MANNKTKNITDCKPNRTGSIYAVRASEYYNKGIALKNLKRYDEVIGERDKALMIDRNSLSSLKNKNKSLTSLLNRSIKIYFLDVCPL